MRSSPRPPAKRRRLTPEVRRGQIVEAAAGLVLQQGHLPLPMDALARSAGASKALIYAYFPTQHDLFNALLSREFRALEARGVVEASAQWDLNQAAFDCALLYFEHVASAGPLIHLILRDPYMAGHVAQDVAIFRDRIIRRLARRARGALRLRAKENIAAINMIITIPEEAGRLKYAGDISLDRGRELCRQLMLSSLDAFTPRAESPTGRRA
jgi:AcrR family transcriptional regulator